MKEFAYIITAASIVGTAANSFQKRWCFLIWMCTNSFWIIYNIIYKSYAQALLYSFNLIMAIIGLIKWKDKPTDYNASKYSKKTNWTIERIELAFGFKLHEWQKVFIFEGKPYGSDIAYVRRNGKTTAHCLRACLSEGAPLIARSCELGLQQFYGEDGGTRARKEYFIEELQKVYKTLNNARVETRQIIFPTEENTNQNINVHF